MRISDVQLGRGRTIANCSEGFYASSFDGITEKRKGDNERASYASRYTPRADPNMRVPSSGDRAGTAMCQQSASVIWVRDDGARIVVVTEMRAHAVKA